MKLRVVLVGLGRMGKNHHRVLRETPEFELVAVVDPVAPAPDGTPILRSLGELAGVDFDAAVVATPTATHKDVALALIAMGKHVLVEKPIASGYAQAVEVIEAARAQKVQLAVAHVERFNPAVRKLREVIREGWVGTPIHFAFTRVGGYPETVGNGNNVILDLAVHDLDVLRSLVGPVKLEHSMCHVTWRDGVVDTAEIFLAAPHGASASVHVNWVTPTKIRTIRVTGTRGVCFVDYILQTCELLGGSLIKRSAPETWSFESFQELYKATDRIQFGVPKVEPLRAQAAQFAALIATGAPGELCSGKDALAAVLLAERAVEVERHRAHDDAPAASDELPTPDAAWV